MERTSGHRAVGLRRRSAFVASPHVAVPAGFDKTREALARAGQPFGGAFGPGKAWAAGRRLPRLGRRYRDLGP